MFDFKVIIIIIIIIIVVAVVIIIIIIIIIHSTQGWKANARHRVARNRKAYWKTICNTSKLILNKLINWELESVKTMMIIEIST